MPKIMREFACECGLVTERFIDVECKEINCECGKQAKRIVGMPTVKLEGLTGDFPGAHAKWAKIREDNARQKARRE